LCEWTTDGGEDDGVHATAYYWGLDRMDDFVLFLLFAIVELSILAEITNWGKCFLTYFESSVIERPVIFW